MFPYRKLPCPADDRISQSSRDLGKEWKGHVRTKNTNLSHALLLFIDDICMKKSCQMVDLFNVKIDRNLTNVIDLAELRHFFERHGLEMDQDILEDIFAAWDINNKGRIDIDELIFAVRRVRKLRASGVVISSLEEFTQPWPQKNSPLDERGCYMDQEESLRQKLVRRVKLPPIDQPESRPESQGHKFRGLLKASAHSINGSISIVPAAVHRRQLEESTNTLPEKDDWPLVESPFAVELRKKNWLFEPVLEQANR